MDQVKQENLISERDATYKSTTLMPEARSPIGLNHNPYSAHRQQQPLQATYSAYDNSQLIGSTLSCNRDEFTGPQSIDQLAPTDPTVAYSIPHHRSDVSHNYRFESIYSHPMEYASLNNNNCFNEQLQAAHVTIGGSNNNNFYVEEQYSTADYQYHPQTYSQQHRKANSWQSVSQDCQYAYNYYDTYQTNELHNQNEPVSDRSGYYSSSDHLACSQQESQQEHDTMHPSLAVGDQRNDAHKDQSQRLDSEDIETSYYKLSSQQSIKTDLPIEHQGEYTPDLCKLHEIRPPSGHQHLQTPPEARLARTIQQPQQQIKFKSMVGKQSGTRSHSSSNPVVQRTNQCGVCGRNYARPSTLKTHLRTHTNERPFKCNVCYKTFSQAANLTAHQRVHTGERPFSCPICGRQFSQSSSVITHLRTHSGERPYRCAMCSRTFSDSSTLTKHRRIHSGEKPYQCDYCPLNFSQSGNLSRHLKLHLMGTSSTSSTVSSTSSNSSSSSLSS